MTIDYLPGVRATKYQRRVLTNYLTNGGDKVDAYYKGMDKVPNPKHTDKRIRDLAYKYFNSPTMRALMKEADIETRLKMENRAVAGLETAIEKYAITKDRILGELAKIAFAQQTDVASWNKDGVIIKDSDKIGDASAAVSEVSQSGGGDSPVVVKVKMLDKQQALISLGREIGMFNPKVEHRGQIALAVGAKFIVEKD